MAALPVEGYSGWLLPPGLLAQVRTAKSSAEGYSGSVQICVWGDLGCTGQVMMPCLKDGAGGTDGKRRFQRCGTDVVTLRLPSLGNLHSLTARTKASSSQEALAGIVSSVAYAPAWYGCISVHVASITSPGASSPDASSLPQTCLRQRHRSAGLWQARQCGSVLAQRRGLSTMSRIFRRAPRCPPIVRSIVRSVACL